MGTWTNEDLKSAQVTDPIIIHSFSTLLGPVSSGSLPSADVWPVADLALYIPFVLHNDQTVKRMLVEIGASSGNLDAGIYTEGATRKVSIGSTVVGTTNDVQELDIGDIFLVAGRYYMALVFDNATASVPRYAVLGYKNRMVGIKEETSAFPLPATATFAEHVDRNYLPSVAVTLVA